MTVTVMITTGGTGGHIFPGLSVAAALQARGARVFWLGTRDGMEKRLVPAHGIEFEAIDFGSVRGKGLRRLLFGPFAIASACLQALRILRRRSPSVVLGLGGFVSFPGGLMAAARNLPLIIHNLDAKAGLANRVLKFGADRVFTGFPGVLGEGRDRRVECVGNPLRADIVALPPPDERFAGRGGPLNLLVVGGSLGAAALNDCVPRALALLPRTQRPVVTHQAGEKHIDALRAAYAAADVDAECLPFIDDMARRYAQADVVICRSGATTLAELAAVGLPSMLVPFPYAADDHQYDNAREFARHHAADVVRQDSMTPEFLAGWLRGLTREGLLAMARSAYALRRVDATRRITDACLALGAGR